MYYLYSRQSCYKFINAVVQSCPNDIFQSGPPRHLVLTIFQSSSSVIFPEPCEWQNRDVPFVGESCHLFSALWSTCVSELTTIHCTDTFLWGGLMRREAVGWIDRRKKGVEEGIINTEEVWKRHTQTHYFYKLHIYSFSMHTCIYIYICIGVTLHKW